MQEENHLFQGLKRDNHQIRQESSFLWNAHNIRLTNRDDSTLLSITNERGTSDENVTFMGYYVGHCVLGKYLVVFTANDDDSDNYIYRVEKTDTGYKTIILFHEEDGWDKSWNPNYPIEAIGVYETELVQKVYWVDGKNQPRVINIAKPELELPTHIDVNGKKYPLLINGVNLSGPNYSEDSNVAQYLEYTIPNGLYQKDSFNFISTLKLNEKIEVTKSYGEGTFAPGVIQYAFTYYNKYGSESNIFYTTPLQYISPSGRGASPEESVANFFSIVITNVDKNFDYLRVYSIHRTSINAVPTVIKVTDVPVVEDNILIVDKGTSGETVDPTQLLYIGGRDIVATTITQKDNTLFLGGISIQEDKNWLEVKSKVKEYIGPEEWTVDVLVDSREINSKSSVYYSHEDNLDNKGGFKRGETYRCGIQLQKANGSWTSPIFLEDRVLTNAFPQNADKSVVITSSEVTLNGLAVKYLKENGYVRARTCVVFPTLSDRTILCQGVLCPTVFSAGARITNTPYAQSSWFFRPATVTPFNNNNVSNVYYGASIEFQHNRPLLYGKDRGAEIQGMMMPEGATKFSDITQPTDYSNSYFVDENLVTFHSPDIEFDTSLQANKSIYEGAHLNIIGAVRLGAVIGDINIQTSSPTISTKASGFNHLYIGHPTKTLYNLTGGLVSGLFYNDALVPSDFNIEISNSNNAAGFNFMVYPWNRSGSLNNDAVRPPDSKARSSVLKKKKISNLKFFDSNISLGADYKYDITTPQLFNSNEVSILKPEIGYLNKKVPYYGNIDSLVTSTKEYPIFYGDRFSTEIKDIQSDTFIKVSTEPVRIKYKSSPHLVFSLKGEDNDVVLLPRLNSIESLNGEDYIPPSWSDIGKGTDTSGIKTSGKFYYIASAKKLLSSSYYPKTHVGTYAYVPDLKKLFYAVLPKPGYANGKMILPWAGVTSQMDGQIIRLEGDDNYIETPVNGILEPNYPTVNPYIYKGKTKYYKVKVNTLEDGSSECTLEPYTPVETKEEAGTTTSRFVLKQKSIITGLEEYETTPYLLLGELVRDSVTNRFGGNTEEALENNIWIPACEPVSLDNTGDEGEVNLLYKYGDTWYSRYDCLKTYPFTQEDENQVVEIGSFMCETRVNIDGRYDKNRGQLSNLNMTPQNFNLLNEVYSQKDNFFNYRIFNEDYYKQHTFANQITWSKEKSAGEEIDTWTNITLANTLDMNGDKGKVTALRTWNEHLLCFQEKALSQILFNSRVQIPTTDGVPIEISNGYKVDGSRLFSSNIGCDDKNSIITTSQGVYFIDSNTDAIYLFNGQLANLSDSKGMNWWVKQSNIKNVWKPISYNNQALNGVRAFYDSKYGDVYFTPGPTDAEIQPDALCYSEKLGQFVSLMSYGGTQAMFNFADGFYSLRHDGNNLKLYQNNVGEYNNFYGEYKGWDFSFISNENPTYTKIFDTIELRADHYQNYNTKEPLNDCPMTFIKVSNEYQQADDTLDNKNMRKKFRVWRGTIPRNNGTRQRIRNPWAMITLGWTPYKDYPEYNTRKAVIHDVSVKYTV